MSIIPQEPLLFRGSLRFNLDPANKHGEGAILEALAKAKMDQAVKRLPMGLEELVEDGGENWSLGERQLLCLARALLQESRVMWMDEVSWPLFDPLLNPAVTPL